MKGVQVDLPQLVPVLSRGKHRNPKRGACFMEMASYLAGEHWSDHPACTHPLLAGLARLVNDNTGDEARTRLAGLIPSVIGLTSDDLRIDAEIALRCACAGLPIAAYDRQRVLATGILSCERMLATLDGRGHDDIREQSRQVLATVPDAWRWACDFSPGSRVSARLFRSQIAPRIVNLSVEGIVNACVPNPEQRLRDLLVDVVDTVTAMVRPATALDRRPALDRSPALDHTARIDHAPAFLPQ